VLFTARDAVGPSQGVMWAMRADTIAAHRPALVDFFEDYLRAVRWFLDPANHKEAIAICAEVTKLPEENLDYAFTTADFYHSPDAIPDIALVQKEIDEVVELKVLPKPVTVNPRYVDLSLVEEAKQRIDGK
jgi:NitT/TauT family transport system substrate-binding protein